MVVALMVAALPTQTAGLLTVTVGTANNETVPVEAVLKQLVEGLVTTTLYAPPAALLKLATLPGLVAPTGTVHA